MANAIKALTPEDRWRLASILQAENNHDLVAKLGLNDYPMYPPGSPITPQNAENTEGSKIEWGFVFVFVFAIISAYHMLNK